MTDIDRLLKEADHASRPHFPMNRTDNHKWLIAELARVVRALKAGRTP